MCDDKSYAYENLVRDGILNQDLERLKFKSIAEFQDSVRRGSEIVFVWDKTTYSLTHTRRDGKRYVVFSESYHEADDGSDLFESSEDVLNQVIDGKKLREIITEVLVVERTL